MDVRDFFIRPYMPEKIGKLQDLAFNLWSYWDKEAERLFHRINPKLFRKLNHNPIELLYKLSSEKLEELAKDKGFLHEFKRVYEKFENYMNYEGTYESEGSNLSFQSDDIVAYICMEYGLHESIPLYSGGLAVLAGDQLKASSDVGVPIVSFGLLYKHGYFNQRITSDGTQIEEFKESMWLLRAVREVLDENGNPVIIEIPLQDAAVKAKIWSIEVGKVKLYLLDTNIHQNPPEFRTYTNMLYDSDRKIRLIQELILGRGSVIALRALGIKPKVYHLNEGHTSFAILQRLLDLVGDQGLSMEEAKAIIRASTVFTTHTPVIEGNEHFPDELVKKYVENEVEELGITMTDFLSLGKVRKEKMFWLPAFALRFSRCNNGVSEIHASVSRNMWRDIFPTLHDREMPIDSVTNGVHIQSWLSLQMIELLDRYLGPDYLRKPEEAPTWNNVYEIPDGEIWNAHRRRKEQVMSFIRRRIGEMMRQRGYGMNKISDIEQVLNPDYLTIGFARRMASYKRATLLFSDPERLARILTNKDRPIQLVFAGKAHPADGIGKNIIKEIFDFINRYPVENHVVFLEDYDINVARHLVQGVDVWLNTPQKPMEASGTSGIKAAINGVLNLSVLDGWWPEAYNGENGWAILGGDIDGEPELSRKAEANYLYDLLENEIAERYYDRNEGDLPREWVKMMKHSIATVSHKFSMQRAVREYLSKFYIPQMKMTERITANDCAVLREVLSYKEELDQIWPVIHIRDYFTSIHGRLPVSGENVNVDAYIYLGDINRNLISVEVFYCFDEGARTHIAVPLDYIEQYEDKVAKYSCKLDLKGTGLQTIGVRIVPSDNDFREVYPEYVKWKD